MLWRYDNLVTRCWGTCLLLLALLCLAAKNSDDSLCLLYLKVCALGNLLGGKVKHCLCAVKAYC